VAPSISLSSAFPFQSVEALKTMDTSMGGFGIERPVLMLVGVSNSTYRQITVEKCSLRPAVISVSSIPKKKKEKPDSNSI